MKFRLPALICVLAVHSAIAQQPQIPGLPGGNPPGGALGNVDANTVRQLRDQGLQIANMTGQEIADEYERYTGKRVIVHSQAAEREFQLFQRGPLTPEEAAELISIKLHMEGFALVPSGGNLIKMVLSTGGSITPQGEGLKLYSEADQLPDGDQIVMYSMKFSYLKPEEAQRVFTSLLGAAAGQTTIAPVTNASALIITGKIPVVRSLIDAKSRIDVPSARLERRWVRVVHADVEELKERLDELFGNATSGGNNRNTAAVQRGGATPSGLPPGALPSGGGGDAAAAAGGGSAAGEQVPLQVIADRRTNRIFLQGRPSDLLEAEAIIEDFDQPTDNRNRLRRRLNFLAVSNFLDVAVNALAAIEGPDVEAGERTGNTGGNAGGGRVNSGGGGGGGGGFGGTGGATGSRSDVLQAPETSNAPESVQIGRTLLVADNISNSIIVFGPPQSIEVISSLLDDIDVRSDQVMIAAVFGQMGLNDEQTTNFNVLKAISEDVPIGGGGGGSAGGFDIEALIDRSATTAVPGVSDTVAGASGLGLYGKIADFSLYFRALQSNTDFKLLARPTVFATNNEKAEIQSGTRVAFPSGTSQSGFNQGGTFNTNIEYQDVVLKLEVIPLVNSDDEVTLQIALVSDNIGRRVDVGNVEDVPEIVTRELITTVTVKNGQTIALGGLITVRDDTTRTGIPIAKDIPFLGRLFRSDRKVEARDELVIFIQPTIVSGDDPDDADNLRVSERARYKVSDAVVDLMENPGVLPPKPYAGQSGVPAKGGYIEQVEVAPIKKKRESFFKGRKR